MAVTTTNTMTVTTTNTMTVTTTNSITATTSGTTRHTTSGINSIQATIVPNIKGLNISSSSDTKMDIGNYMPYIIIAVGTIILLCIIVLYIKKSRYRNIKVNKPIEKSSRTYNNPIYADPNALPNEQYVDLSDDEMDNRNSFYFGNKTTSTSF